jgi:hypothetical protein
MIRPARGFDMGAGPGKPVEKTIRGGTVGLVLDGRGRPLAPKGSAPFERVRVAGWVEALELYPKVTVAP